MAVEGFAILQSRCRTACTISMDGVLLILVVIVGLGALGVIPNGSVRPKHPASAAFLPGFT